MDRTEFLRARLDETADRETRKFEDTWRYGDPCVECGRPADSVTHWSSGPPVAKFEPCGHEIDDYSQLARYTKPAGDAFILAEVDAKRRTLLRCEEALLTGNPMLVHFAQETLREMALPYAGHPDYLRLVVA